MSESEAAALSLVRTVLEEMGFGSLWTGTLDDAGLDSLDRTDLEYRICKRCGMEIVAGEQDTIKDLAARLALQISVKV